MGSILICSRYTDEVRKIAKNKQLARIYCRMAWDKGFFPIAPHLYLPQVLDYGNKAERGAALKLSLKALEKCAEVWVFGGNYSKGMRAAIERAAVLNIPVKYFDEYGDPL